jgi:dienelactone hydrolase
MPEIGQSILHYSLMDKIGKGGMGEVFLAKDRKLGRDVAIKVLPEEFARDTDRVARFQREAKLLASLNHPNIAAIHGLEEAEGINFLVLELVEGETLADRIGSGPVPVEEALKLALQIAEALEAAHKKGVLHRDLKPANIKVTPDGIVKVLDFGLAKAFAGEQQEATLTFSPSLSDAATRQGVVLGTPAYMSPEQVEGKPLDERSDIFSFGAVLYELLTGKRVFQRDSTISTLSAILHDTPVRAGKVRPEVPRKLEACLNRCLEKNRDLRYASASDLHRDIAEFETELFGRSAGWRALLQPRIALPASLVLVAVIAAAALFGVRIYRESWAVNEALPEIARLTEQGEYARAFELAKRAGGIIPGNKVLASLWPGFSQTVTLLTDPPGAAVSMKEYAVVAAPWKTIGQTPLKDYRIPRAYFRWRISKAGYEELETGGPPYTGDMNFRLVPVGSPESNMACLPAGEFVVNLAGFGLLGPWPMEAYCIDRFEVTNRQFKQFVDAGGYRKREYWQQPFVENGRRLTWEEAMKRFVDSSGRPGPAAWEAGAYREGQDNLPVGGVSWYEAAAYAEYAGKSLPTLYHWYNATGIGTNSDMVPLSNFAGKGEAPVGTYPGVSLHGVYDMAGNHREWVSTGTQGRFYLLGGAWNEPSYFLAWSQPRPPFDRATDNGFRCARYGEGKTPPARYAGVLDRQSRDYSREKPVSDETFKIFESFYPRDTGPLNARVESEDVSPENWRKLKVSYSAGYGGERLPAYLFLPKNAAPPPHQAVVWFPGAYALQLRKSDPLTDLANIDFIIKSGRALLYPIYKGIYERDAHLQVGDQSRENVAWWLSEVRRSVDYLVSRPDIDASRIAYLGGSWGARLAPIFLAMEPRVRAAVLLGGGYPLKPRRPEVDEFNYSPRVKAPVLMINGRYDFVFPLEASAIRMFAGLGTPADRKKLVIVESGHAVTSFRSTVTRETLDWLDRYLGPVK